MAAGALPSMKEMQKLFMRYDLDGSGSLNHHKELWQMTTNVLFVCPAAGTRNHNLDELVAAVCHERGGLEDNPMTLQDFIEWFTHSFEFTAPESTELIGEVNVYENVLKKPTHEDDTQPPRSYARLDEEQEATLLDQLGRQFSFKEYLKSQLSQLNFSCWTLNRGSDESEKERSIEAQTNCSIVSALMFGVALSGFLTTPEPIPGTDPSRTHLGWLLGSTTTNMVLWCITSVVFLVSTLAAVFYISMVQQVDTSLFSLYEDLMGPQFLLHTPIILCYLGIVAMIGSFLSYLVIVFGERNTACCLFGCIPCIVGWGLYAQSRCVFAATVTAKAQHCLDTRSEVDLRPEHIVSQLEQYMAEVTVSRASWDGFLEYITPQLSLNAMQHDAHVQRRTALLTRGTLTPYTVKIAEAIYNRVMQEHIESVTASVELSAVREAMQAGTVVGD